MKFNTREGNTMDKQLLDESEVSGMTGIPVKTLQYWRFNGTTHAPKFIKLGKRVYYRPQDLNDWLDQQQTYQKTSDAKTTVELPPLKLQPD
jgi:predicted DNA-binding transcriptional regulator AlpA